MDNKQERFKIARQPNSLTKEAILTLDYLTIEDAKALPQDLIYVVTNRTVYATIINAGLYANYYTIGTRPDGDYAIVYDDATLDIAKAHMARYGYSLC